MVDPEWLGGKKDKRLYRKVRAEKQKGIRKKYDLMKAHLNERGDFHEGIGLHHRPQNP